MACAHHTEKLLGTCPIADLQGTTAHLNCRFLHCADDMLNCSLAAFEHEEMATLKVIASAAWLNAGYPCSLRVSFLGDLPSCRNPLAVQPAQQPQGFLQLPLLGQASPSLSTAPKCSFSRLMLFGPGQLLLASAARHHSLSWLSARSLVWRNSCEPGRSLRRALMSVEVAHCVMCCKRSYHSLNFSLNRMLPVHAATRQLLVCSTNRCANPGEPA